MKGRLIFLVLLIVLSSNALLFSMPPLPNIIVSIRNETNNNIECIVTYNKMKRWKFYSSYYRVIKYIDEEKTRSKIVYAIRNNVSPTPNNDEDIFFFTTYWEENLEDINLFINIINLIIDNIIVKDTNGTILNIINNFDVNNIIVEMIYDMPLMYYIIIDI